MEEDMSIKDVKRNANKRTRNSISTIPPKFKGVVPQSNGHWGAQIYANHQRVWLGTFKSEIYAAMAYDSASIKLRTGDNQRNFPWSNITVHEPRFQSFHSAEEILNMIRDGSYQPKFANYVRSQIGGHELCLNVMQDHSGFSCSLLFQKDLTPSDVSKLNRLVVPKKYAVKYFPLIADMSEENEDGPGKVEEVHLFFYDRMMRLWKFRYCYWKSSQSFVFTRGWNRFVKEKKLKANDMIAFYICEGRERAKDGQSFWLIDIGCSGESRDIRVVKEIDESPIGMKMDLHLRLGQENSNYGLVIKEKKGEDQMLTRFGASPNNRKRSVRLFGVDIK